jgi:hypothetical protein
MLVWLGYEWCQPLLKVFQMPIFCSNAVLEGCHLEGCHFKWCHFGVGSFKVMTFRGVLFRVDILIFQRSVILG